MGTPRSSGQGRTTWRSLETRQTVLRGHAVSQHVRCIRLTQPLERAVAKLANPLARHAELARDFLQSHRPAPLEPEVQRQHATISRREHLERARDRFATRIAFHPTWQHILI